MPTIQTLRTQIDSLNLRLLEVLSERAKLAEEIGELQTQMGTAHYDPVREAEMLDTLTQANSGPFTDATVKCLSSAFCSLGLGLSRP